MYRQPGTISISGTFSQQGRFSNTFTDTGNRLQLLQQLFERIKDESVFVDILSIYNVRKNCVLYGIAWNEGANTLDYTFSFKEVYTANITEIEYEVDVTDENLPALTDPLQLDLTDTLIDWEEVDTIVIKALQDAGLVDDEFLLAVQSLISNDNVRTTVLIGGVVTVAIGAKVITTALAMGAAIPGVGWILVGVGALAVGLYFGLTAIKKSVEQKKYLVKAFKNYKDDRRQQAEATRFLNFIGTIHQQLEVLEQSGKVYSIPSNINQECIISIDGNYYIFKFEKNNTSQFWALEVKDMNEEIVCEVSSMVGLKSIADATQRNNLFASKNGSYVYLINTKLIEEDQYKDWDDELKYYGDLRNFVFFITSVDMEKWNDLILDIVVNAITV